MPRVLCLDEGGGALSSAAQALDLEFDVVATSLPKEALSLLEREGDFAVLIVDASAPSVTVVELLEAVKQVSPTTACVLMTPALDNAWLEQRSVFRCVSKPCASDALLSAVSDAANYHRLLATSPAQPVEGIRAERDAIMPPAKSGARPMGPAVSRGLFDIAGELPNPVVIHVQPSQAPSRPTETAHRVGLRVAGRTIELLPGLTVVGRSRTCHIPIPDPRISRRHACFSNTGHELTVCNVSNSNRVLVNGVGLERDASCVLEVRDHVRLGSQDIEICALGDYCPSIEPTHGLPPEPRGDERGQALSTLVTLAQVADKCFLLGQSREAERILRPLLEGLLRHCESGQLPLAADRDLAVDLTLRIAEANGAGEWVNYLFELFAALEKPMPPEVVERLYRIIPEMHGVSMVCFRDYVDTLGRIVDRLGPKERFIIRRIKGLEAPLMMSAHL